MVKDLSGLLNTMLPATAFADFESRVTALKTVAKKIKVIKPPKEISAKKQQKIAAEKIELRKKMEERKAKNLIEKKVVDNRNFNKRKYKTKAVDYSQLVTIRINAKTFIYSKPGEEEITKANFLKNYNKSLSQKDQNSNQ